LEAIATYQSVWFEGRYRFYLFTDAVRVSGATFLQAEAEFTVPLAGLQARVDRRRVRSKFFWAGLWVAIVGYFGSAVLVAGFRLDPFGFASALFITAGFAGVLQALVTVRKIEYAQFVTDAGVPAVTIPRTRRGKADFDWFVEKVLWQIRACKGLA
jgi:hypothetical protein